MTTRFTDKTFRSQNGDWVKVTRDNKERNFTFAIGYKGEVVAYRMETLPFKWVANWKEAEEQSQRMLGL